MLEPPDGKEEEERTLLSEEDTQPLVGEAELPDRKSQQRSLIDSLLTLIYCVTYLLVGPALILTNKRILRDIGFGYPMIVSGIGQVGMPARPVDALPLLPPGVCLPSTLQHQSLLQSCCSLYPA